MDSTQPLHPFAPPSGLPFSINLSSGASLEILLAFVFVIWLVFTLVAIYHWLKYSHGSWIAVPAICVHLFISFALISFGLTGAFAPLL